MLLDTLHYFITGLNIYTSSGICISHSFRPLFVLVGSFRKTENL
jgi:hypothetical protein